MLAPEPCSRDISGALKLLEREENNARSLLTTCAALDDVDDGLEVAVVVGARLGVGMDVHRPGPDLLRPHACEVHRRGAVHARRRVRIRIERAARDHAHAFVLPAVAWGRMRVCVIGRRVGSAGGGHDVDLDRERGICGRLTIEE